MRTEDDILLELNAVEKELSQTITSLAEVETTTAELSRKRAEITLRMNDFKIPLIQGKSSVKKLNIRWGALKREYFNFGKAR